MYSVSVTDASSPLRSNLWKLYALRAGSGFVLYFPILVLFLQEQGFSYRHIFLYHAVSSLMGAAWQIPSGYLADKWSRRNVIGTGCILNLAGLLCYCLSPTLPSFLLGGALIGTGFSFLSGSIEALTFESLAFSGEDRDFRKMIGRQNFIRFGAETVASFIGGALALASLHLPFWFTLIPFLFMLVIAWTLHEPSRHLVHEEHHLSALGRIVRYAFIENSALRSIIVLHGFLAGLSLTLYWFSQPYQELVGMPLAFFGPMHAIVVGLGGIASAFTHRMERWLHDWTFYCLIALTIVVSYVTLGFFTAWWGLLFIILMRIGWGFLSPLTADIVTRMTTANIRATVLSITGMGGQILWAILPFAFGTVADRFSIHATLLSLGIFSAITLIPLLLMARMTWGKTNA